MDRFTALTYGICLDGTQYQNTENKSMQTFFDTLQRAMARRNLQRCEAASGCRPFDITSEHQQLSPANERNALPRLKVNHKSRANG